MKHGVLVSAVESESKSESLPSVAEAYRSLVKASRFLVAARRRQAEVVARAERFQRGLMHGICRLGRALVAEGAPAEDPFRGLLVVAPEKLVSLPIEDGVWPQHQVGEELVAKLSLLPRSPRVHAAWEYLDEEVQRAAGAAEALMRSQEPIEFGLREEARARVELVAAKRRANLALLEKAVAAGWMAGAGVTVWQIVIQLLAEPVIGAGGGAHPGAGGPAGFLWLGLAATLLFGAVWVGLKRRQAA